MHGCSIALRPISLVLTLVLPALAHAQVPVDAGTMMEQQRSHPLDLGAKVLTSPEISATPSPAVAGGSDNVARVVLQGFIFEGNAHVSVAVLRLALESWLHRPIGMADLQQATAAIEGVYLGHGWFAQARVPSQDITQGFVRIVITEARMGQLKILNNSGAVSPALQERAENLFKGSLPTGVNLDVRALERATAIADDTPGMRASSSLQAGTDVGSTDVLLSLSPASMWQGGTSVDNAGNRATGDERVNAVLSLNSPWGHGEKFGFNFSKSRGSDYLSFSADAPLGGDGWRFASSVSALRYRVLDAYNTTTGLPPQGRGGTADLELQYPLVASPLSRLQLTLGYEVKHIANDDDNSVFGQLAASVRAKINSSSIGLRGSQIDRLGLGGANVGSLVYSQSSLRLEESPLQYLADDSQNANTQGHSRKLRWTASRTQFLGSQWSLLGVASGQWASRNLASSERFYLGGMNGVRAYPTSEGSGSRGQLFSLELRRYLGAQWQISAFYDWGKVHQFADNRRKSGSALVDSNSITLRGHGLGLEWRGKHGLVTKVIWAARQGRNPLATPSGNDTDGSLVKNRFWFSTSLFF